jgi:thiamine monophosphate synthase
VLLSPVIAPRKGRPALGLEALERCRGSLRPGTQLFALGGVSAETARSCLEHGADGVAVIGAALGAGPARSLLKALGISVDG